MARLRKTATSSPTYCSSGGCDNAQCPSRQPAAMTYAVDADITVAATLDPSFYSDPAAWALASARIFARTGPWIGDLANFTRPESLAPRILLPGLLDEPLLLARDRDN